MNGKSRSLSLREAHVCAIVTTVAAISKLRVILTLTTVSGGSGRRLGHSLRRSTSQSTVKFVARNIYVQDQQARGSLAMAHGRRAPHLCRKLRLLIPNRTSNA